MKKYKTWEVIKMLEENPELEFRCINSPWTIKIFDNKIGFFESGISTNARYIVKDAEWTLEQQPVTFMEALNSSKLVRVEHEIIEKYHCRCVSEDIVSEWKKIKDKKYMAITSIVLGLSYMLGQSHFQEVINNGKWYIEEETENEV